MLIRRVVLRPRHEPKLVRRLNLALAVEPSRRTQSPDWRVVHGVKCGARTRKGVPCKRPAFPMADAAITAGCLLDRERPRAGRAPSRPSAVAWHSHKRVQRMLSNGREIRMARLWRGWRRRSWPPPRVCTPRRSQCGNGARAFPIRCRQPSPRSPRRSARTRSRGVSDLARPVDIWPPRGNYPVAPDVRGRARHEVRTPATRTRTARTRHVSR